MFKRGGEKIHCPAKSKPSQNVFDLVFGRERWGGGGGGGTTEPSPQTSRHACNWCGAGLVRETNQEPGGEKKKDAGRGSKKRLTKERLEKRDDWGGLGDQSAVEKGCQSRKDKNPDPKGV